MNATPHGVPWPTPMQADLLRIALWDQERAAAIWERLRPGFVLDDVWDADTYRLLPLVYRKLRALGADDPILARLKGLHRREWSRNRVRLSRLARLIDRLEQSGTATMLLNGVPLALRYYEDLGARPIDHAAVLVPAPRAVQTLELLADDGWSRPGEPNRRERLDTRVGIRYQQARLAQSADGEVVELHWQLGAPFVLPGYELRSADTFWESAVRMEVDGMSTRTLRAGDQLLQVIVNGLTSPRGGRAQWCADAFVVMAGHDELDWDRFVGLAESRRLSLVADVALGYLVDTLEAAVPTGVRAALSHTTRTRHDLRAFEVSLPNGPHRSVARALFDLGSVWAWRRAKLSPTEAALDLAGFLQDAWCLPRRRDVPSEAILRLARRLRRRLGSQRSRAGTGKIVRSWGEQKPI